MVSQVANPVHMDELYVRSDVVLPLPPDPARTERVALRRLGGVVLSGAIAAWTCVAVVGTLVAPLLMTTRCGCGSTLGAAEARALRQRCLETGLTPEELRAMDGAAAASAGAGP